MDKKVQELVGGLIKKRVIAPRNAKLTLSGIKRTTIARDDQGSEIQE